MVFPLSPSTSLANNTTRPGPSPAPSTAKKLSPPTVRFTSPALPAPAAGADDATSSKSGRARSAAPGGEDDGDEVDEVEDSEEEEGGAISMEFTSGDDGGRILGEPSEGDRTGATDEEHERREDDARSPSFVEPEALAPLHVEVRLLQSSTLRYDLIRRMLHTHIDSSYDTLVPHAEVNDWRDVAALAQNVDRVWIGECSLQTPTIPLSLVSLQIHVYQPTPSNAPPSFLLSESGDGDEGNLGDIAAASILSLPSEELEGIWDSLIYECEVKERLLGYIYSTILFGDAMVDFNIVTWNRVVLLHGPPGTGKTSLCRALAQKLSIRLSDRYDHGQLVEINSHSLFSKWFSESGKLVQKLFASITEMVDDESTFIVVLIDEVESLTAARAGAMSGKEPSDALRVVNALLTQLDKLKHRKNCLVMTTSNLSSAIDVAFIDRADIKQYIGLPPAQAVYWILQSCLKEIMRAGLIAPTILHDWQSVELFRSTGTTGTDRHRKCSDLLYDLSHLCHGMSGRTLRRLPVLAHARFIGMTLHGANPPMEVWLEAMRKAVAEESAQMDRIGQA